MVDLPSYFLFLAAVGTFIWFFRFLIVREARIGHLVGRVAAGIAKIGSWLVILLLSAILGEELYLGAPWSLNDLAAYHWVIAVIIVVHVALLLRKRFIAAFRVTACIGVLALSVLFLFLAPPFSASVRGLAEARTTDLNFWLLVLTAVCLIGIAWACLRTASELKAEAAK